MSTGPIHARSERTSDQIAIDRKEANAFFARIARMSPGRIHALSVEASIDPKLVMIVAVAEEWRNRETARRAAAQERQRAREQPARELSPYVSAETRAAMPAPRLHPLTETVRKQSLKEAQQWRYRVATPSPARRRRILRDANVPFVQWLAVHPNYGPARPANADAESPRRHSRLNYRGGSITPVGMTASRAMEIAQAALSKA